MNRLLVWLPKTRGVAAAVGLVVAAGIVLVAFLAGYRTDSTGPSAPSVPLEPAPSASAALSRPPVPTAIPPSPPAPSAAAATAVPGEDPALPTATVQADPVAVEAATVYAATWLNAYPPITAAAWRDVLRPLQTADVTALLADVDPVGSVPVGRAGSPVRGTLHGEVATVHVPIVDNLRQPLGDLILDLFRIRGQWIVSSVDWSPA